MILRLALRGVAQGVRIAWTLWWDVVLVYLLLAALFGLGLI